MPSTVLQHLIARVEELIKLGQNDQAEAICLQAINASPQQADGWSWLGVTHLLRQQMAEAEVAFRRAANLRPNDPQIWSNLGTACMGQQRFDQAEACYRNALSIQPSTASYWDNLAAACNRQQKWSDAAQALQTSLNLNPQNALAWENFAAAEERSGNFESARNAYANSLTIAPNPEAGLKFAALLIRLGELPLAVHVLRQIVEQVPNHAMAWLILGDVLELFGDATEAERAYRQGLAAEPNLRQAKLSLGTFLRNCLRYSEAGSLASELVAANPADEDAWALIATIKQGQGEIADSLTAISYAITLSVTPTGHHRFLLGALQYADNIAPLQLLAEHRLWNDKYFGEAPARPAAAVAKPQSSIAGRRSSPIRIGFLSANFGQHPIAFLALPAIEHLDRSRCNVALYSDRHSEDEFTARFKAAGDNWRTIAGQTDEDVVRQITADEIDILVDLMGHTGPRPSLFARKPASVQIAWLGYPGTTGLAAMDFLLADRFHIQPGEEAWYSESILRLPHGYACYSPPNYLPEVNALPALANGVITFGSLSNPSKLSPTTLNIWGEILRRVPASRLLLRYGGLDEPQCQAAIRGHFSQRGISPDRIILEGNSRHADHLATYRRIDLALDTQPYSGGVTTCEALWMGVPVITFPGKTFAGRHATSYLANAGYADFIAADANGYIEKAVEWSQRIDDLTALRPQLHTQASQSPIGDTKSFGTTFLDAIQRVLD